ncbi:hypothetical protein Aoki45_38930 [Algoriphagus sp. oki45]|uniref:peptidase, M16 family protein n=1 Tax=Algoriphagus sp. oki45 TaxID=3067294 RepID=UPI0027EC6301|nr:hypothetical protein Aoki45_38930 [Algoriphagus sp. oki45]
MKIKYLFFSAALGLVSFSDVLAFGNPENSSEVAIIENDPATVIANYIKAVGGKDKVNAIKNAKLVMEANIQGQVLELSSIADAENSRMIQTTSVGGNVLQKTMFVNGKAQVMAGGQVQELPDETAAMLKPQTFVFPEERYEEMGFALAYVGVEQIDGEDVHVLDITAPIGIVTKEYYSVATGLKVRTSSDATGEITYSDYQEVDGIKFPMTMTIKNPMLPVPMEAKIKSIEFNASLMDSDFQ